MADGGEVFESPNKRIKLCEDSTLEGANNDEKPYKDNKQIETPANSDISASKVTEVHDEEQKYSSKIQKVFPIHTKEKDVAITEYVSKHKGFHGVLKQRFVDFVVNERDIKDNLVQLTHTNVPPSEKDNTTSDGILSKEDVDNITTVLESKDKSFSVTLYADDDKEHRTLVHKAVKNMFPTLDTETVTVDGHKAVKVYRYHGNPAQKRREKWPANRGNYCRFVLHKENKDTMEAICLLAKLVHVKASVFSYAGTKDRRGVTSQEVTAYRVQAQRLKGLNRTLKGILLGNFEYVQERLTLGQLSGNHFVITLRNVGGKQEEVEEAMTSLKDIGFINYFGLQRFGTAAVPTHHIGKQCGFSPVEGDLVMLGGQTASPDCCSTSEDAIDDSCQPMDDADDTVRTSHNTSVQILTIEDVNSGKYSIHDVIMPVPGYDVTYPGYDAKQFYKDLMAQDGIDIDNLRHRVKDYSLSGAYRRLVIKPGHTCWHFLHYSDVSEPLVLTDRDKFEGKTALEIPPEGKYLALQIELTLPPSCYATMAVREVMKCDTSSSHQATLNKV
ncbi:hypothetical protein QZH41_008791 [Actinostola sp. cb2023]|nr:hypothetical protein QZH41_008791 [Actinostola sp. cb2023]